VVRGAALSENTVPPYNRKFTGRLDELLQLREQLKDDRAGVVCGIHGLGGIGKSELAFTYAHAFAAAYPGGRFLVPCEFPENLREAVLILGEHHEFHGRIADEERMSPQSHFKAVRRCLAERLAEKGAVLLVLDNVTNLDFLGPDQTGELTALGPQLHLLATTRMLPPAGDAHWLTLGELPEADALDLLEKHRGFDDEAEREAARSIVRRLGGFALAVELVAAYVAAHPGASCARLAGGLGLKDLEKIAGDEDVKLKLHNHQRRIDAVLGPVLDGLGAVERRAMEYAALLPPDQVALPWLRALVEADFPDDLAPTRLVADPWKEVVARLERLALLVPAEEESSEPRIVRVHRLVQDVVKTGMSGEQLGSLQQAIDKLVLARAAELDRETHWEEARWELEPLEALAWMWAEPATKTGVPDQTAAAESPPAHPRATGHAHPHLQAALGNYAGLLEAMDRSGGEIESTLAELGARYGVDLGGVGGMGVGRDLIPRPGSVRCLRRSCAIHRKPPKSLIGSNRMIPSCSRNSSRFFKANKPKVQNPQSN